MGLFSRKDKNIYSEYAKIADADNYILSDEGIIPIGQRGNINHSPYALTPDEVLGEEKNIVPQDIPMLSAGESLYARVMNARKNQPDEADIKSEEVKKQTESLLSRCTPFVENDGEKPILTKQAAYTLDSVEDIIAEAERRAQERVKKLYKGEENGSEEKEVTVSENEPTSEPEDIMMSRVDVKNYQYRFADENRSSEDIVEKTSTPVSEPETAEEKTISFVPVTEEPAPAAEEATMPFTPVVDETEEMLPVGLGIGEKIPSPEDIMPTDEELFGDYETVADAEPIHNELKAKVRKINVKLFVTTVFALILTFISISTAVLGDNAMMPAETAVIISTLFTAVAAIINFEIWNGISALFGKTKSTDTALCISTLVSFAYGVVCIATSTPSAQFGYICLIGMMFSIWGKRNNAKRILIGFEEIASAEEKEALTLIDENHGSYAIAKGAVDGDALIAACKKTINITHYLKNSKHEDSFTGKSLALSLIGICVSVVATIWALFNLPQENALSIFTAFCAVCAPFSTSLIGTRPSLLAAKRLSDRQCMIVSPAASETITQVNAVVFDALSIFPRGRVKMYDMKVLSSNDLEKTIFNAAAVCTSINSPLGHVFRRIARTSETYVLPSADSVKYEKRMGVSGWVGDDSLLIGNRTLMETHGVSVPSVEVDKKILRSGYFPVYVASNGVPCALLIVGYEVDRNIENEFRRLQNSGIVILVNNCDPNITEEMLCDYFGLSEDFVKIMQSDSVKAYHEQTEFLESVSAPACINGNADGLAAVITSAVRMKNLGSLMAVLHIIMLIVGIAGATVLMALGYHTLISPISVAVYLAASLILVCLPSILYRP